MSDSLKYIFALVVSYIMTIPYIAVMFIGLYSLFLTLVSLVVEKTDKVLQIGYGVSSIICLVGAFYGYFTDAYFPVVIGPIILVLVYRYHIYTYG